MGKSLVIVESPAKAKTINKYLGSDFVVKSSVGHIRDLPTSGSTPAEKPTKSSTLSKEDKAKQQLIRRMGVPPSPNRPSLLPLSQHAAPQPGLTLTTAVPVK